jgi:hypothetical protein
MSEGNVTTLLGLITSGGASGVIALLILVIFGLLWDRRRVFSEYAKKEEKLDALMESHYKSNMAVGEALNSIKIVLAEISVKLIR